MRYTLTLTLTLAACFGMQALALRSVGGRTTKCESNFFSALGRIQAGSRGNPQIMLLGSSITGRLPDRAQGFTDVANLGCEGGSAVDTLRAIDQGILPSAPWIVIEANTLQLALQDKPSEVAAAMNRPWFRAGMSLPLLGAYARPSAFLYSKLLARRIGNGTSLGKSTDLGVRVLPAKITSENPEKISQAENTLLLETREIIERLHSRGCRTLVVHLPPARSDSSEPPAWVLSLVKASNSLWWDLGQQATPGTIRLTDDVHMDQQSATKTLNSLLLGIQSKSAQ